MITKKTDKTPTGPKTSEDWAMRGKFHGEVGMNRRKKK